MKSSGIHTKKTHETKHKIDTHTHTDTHTHPHTHTDKHMHTNACKHTNMHVRTYACTHTHTRTPPATTRINAKMYINELNRFISRQLKSKYFKTQTMLGPSHGLNIVI